MIIPVQLSEAKMAKVKESYLDEDEAWMEVSSSESVCSEAPAVEELPKEPEVELTPEEKRNKAFREALAEAALKVRLGL